MVEAKSESRSPLVFFYSGTKLPSYAGFSIREAARRYGGPVHLLTDFPVRERLPGVQIEFFPNWFDVTGFLEFSRLSCLDYEFRDGFWLKTVQRFFVLDQWMERENVKSFLHTEVDVALLRPQELIVFLSELPAGFYLPWLSRDLAIASIVWVSGRGAMTSCVEYLLRNHQMGNEMQILAGFLRENPSIAFGLPSTTSFEPSRVNGAVEVNRLTPTHESGIFDGAHLGHWLLGQDPRNRAGKLVSTRFLYDYGPGAGEAFLKLTPGIRHSLRAGLRIQVDSQCIHVNNLHVHSKAMRLAYSSLVLGIYAKVSRCRRPLPVLVMPSIIPYQKSRLKRRVDIMKVRAWEFFLRRF